MAVTSVNVTSTPPGLPCTALSSVTVNTKPTPSTTDTSSTVTAALSLSMIVPVAVSLSITSGLSASRFTLNIS